MDKFNDKKETQDLKENLNPLNEENENSEPECEQGLNEPQEDPKEVTPIEDSQFEDIYSGSSLSCSPPNIYSEPLNTNQKDKSSFFNSDSTFLKVLLIFFGLLVLILASFLGFREFKNWQEQDAVMALAVQKEIDTNKFYEGTIVQGIELGGKTIEEAKALLKDSEKNLREKIDIKVNYRGKTLNLTEDDFDFIYNTNDILEEAFSIARKGYYKTRQRQIENMKSYPINLNISASLNTDDISKAVNKVAKVVDIPAKQPSVSKFDVKLENPFTYSEGKNGSELNKEEFTNELKKQLLSGKIGQITAPIKETQFSGDIEEIKKSTKLLTSFSTVATSGQNSQYNMNIALKRINGTKLKPGEVFSFNSKTGNTDSASSGYIQAAAISGGRIIQSYGGGICQAATTLYGAVIRSDLEIVERHNHLWPSTYAPIGLDATVNYPNLDLKFKNNRDHDIYIGSYMSGNTLIYKVFGAPSNEYDKIEPSSWVTGTQPPPATKHVADSSLAPGSKSVYIQSRTGYSASAKRVYYKNGKEIKTNYLPNSQYRPVGGVVKVGPQT